MISGVVSQGAALPRGALAPSGAYFDFESIASPKVLGADSQAASSGLHTDADGFFTTRFARALVPTFKFDDGSIFAPRIRSAQVLQPALYVAVDVLSLPAVALPGILQTHLHAADDAMFVPFISTHGSLRPALYSAFDVFYAPTLVAAQTLLPGLYVASDAFYAPRMARGFRPSLITDSDTVFAFSSGITGTQTLLPGLVSSDDVFFAPTVIRLAQFDGTTSNVTLSNGNLTVTHSNTTGHAGANTTAIKNTGKFYFEVTVGATHGANDSIGIMHQFAIFSDVSAGQNCTVVQAKTNAPIYSNNASTGKSLGSNLTASDIVGVAIDLIGGKAWFRKNGGLWNNDAAADPATGTNGVTISMPAPYTPCVDFAGTGTATSDNMTANFGSLFSMTVPSGFGFWSA